MLLTILQATLPDIWNALANQGLVFLLLGLAVWTLWKRDSTMADDRKKALAELQGKIDDTNNKMEKYLSEDRKTMLDCINNNTKAFELLKDVLDEIRPK
jgi:hypothetical protein